MTASNFVVGRRLWEAATTMVVFNNHIAYSLLASLAVRLFGTAEWVLRMPAFLLGAATVYVVWRFGRLFSNAAAALSSAALLALSPSFIDRATWARGYSGLALMALISSYSFLVLTRRKSAGAAFSHAASSALAVYFHLYGVWILGVEWIIFLWLAFARRPANTIDIPPAIDSGGLRLLWRSFVAIAAVVLLLYLPVLRELVAIAGIRGRSAIQPALPKELFHSFVSTDSAVLGFGLVALCLLGLLGLLRRRRIEGIYLGVLLGFPFLAMWLVVRPFDLYPRFFIYWAPMFAYLVADAVVGLSIWAWARRSGTSRVLAFAPAIGAWIMIGFVMADWVRQDSRPVGHGYRELLQPAIQHSGWRMFVVGADALILDYYLGRSVEPLDAVTDLETAMHDAPRLLVVYHNMNWNTVEQQRMATILRRSCSTDDRGAVTLFRCVR